MTNFHFYKRYLRNCMRIGIYKVTVFHFSQRNVIPSLFMSLKHNVTIIILLCSMSFTGVVGGTKKLGKLSVPGLPTNLNDSRIRPIALVVGAGGGCLDIFFLSSVFSLFFLPTRYRLKYCLKRPLNPKEPTNQINVFYRN